jgi:hypothetical protein
MQVEPNQVLFQGGRLVRSTFAIREVGTSPQRGITGYPAAASSSLADSAGKPDNGQTLPAPQMRVVCRNVQFHFLSRTSVAHFGQILDIGGVKPANAVLLPL